MAKLIENYPNFGFGLMRLPQTANGGIDIEQTKDMVDMFLKSGFLYFDTAYAYEGSEDAAKLALVDLYPRDSYILATKLSAYDVKTTEEARQIFYTSLERTGAGYFDYYLLHNLGENRTQIFDRHDLWGYAVELKSKGLVKHIGFSFHDQADVLDELLTAHPEMEFVQLQINYVDWENPAIESRKCYDVARKHNKPIIVMEPCKGGTLAGFLPDDVKALFKKANPDVSYASWAIRFAASLEGVEVVLSGMSNLEQVKDNISFMKNFVPLSYDERDVVEQAREMLSTYPTIPCTTCYYCTKNCPVGIPIPHVIKSLNRYIVFSDLEAAQGNYDWDTQGGHNASACIDCGQCEYACPQHIKIREHLKKAAEIFD